MRVSVYDTYIRRSDGRIMHFDILVPATERSLETVYEFGNEYLAEKQQAGQELTSSECQFCHVEEAIAEIANSINDRGFYIIEMENCD